jgi:hypothetical protein
MSYSPVTDTAEHQCQWIHFNLQQLFEVTAPICEHYMHCLSIDCLASLKMTSVCWMSSHAAWMPSKRSASVSTAVSYTKVLRFHQT